MSLRLNGSTSGYTELDAGAVAGNNTIKMPTANGSAYQVLRNGATAGTTEFADKIVSGTAVASTSGTSIDFTGIPSWVKRVTVMFNRISTSGTSQILLQLGAGSIATTNYSTRVTAINGANQTNANVMGNAFGVTSSGNSAAANIISGQIILSLFGSNSWCGCGSTMDNTSASVQWVQAGDVALTGTLDRVRITTVNGTDTFDAGTINILYE
jgi:hypothetical protein